MGRRYVAEFVGTAVIVLAPVALSASAGGELGLMAAAWVSGLSVLAMIYALGHISAAHFNPAVTLAFASAGRFPWRYVLPYWVAQFAGAFAGAGLSRFIFEVGAGAHVPSGPAMRAAGMEVAISFILMLVIISVATDRRANGAIPGLAIGLTVVLGVLIGGSVSGGSMNPARSLGPAVFVGGPALANYLVYLIGPCIGTVLAARLYETIRGGEEHAQGAPNDLAVALGKVQNSA
jgi:MIP family channel proteins